MSYHRDPLPPFAGIPSFFRAPRAPFEELSSGMFAILGAPNDSTMGSRQGTRFGPRGIREASLGTISYMQAGPEGFLTDIASGTKIRLAPGTPLVDLGDLNHYPNDMPRTVD